MASNTSGVSPLKIGWQAKVGGEKREHMGVKDEFSNGHTVEQDPFIMSSSFFGNSDAVFISFGDHDFHPDQFYPFKGKSGCQSGGPCSNAPTVLRRTYPIAQITKFVNGMDMTQSTSAVILT